MASTERQTGQVKWFNRQTGWGFITMKTGNDLNEDIFVHWKSLNISNEQFKYLVAGEYVELNIKFDETNHKHPKTADDVTGVLGGLLMCQFRQLEDSGRKKRATHDSQQQPRRVGTIEFGN